MSATEKRNSHQHTHTPIIAAMNSAKQQKNLFTQKMKHEKKQNAHTTSTIDFLFCVCSVCFFGMQQFTSAGVSVCVCVWCGIFSAIFPIYQFSIFDLSPVHFRAIYDGKELQTDQISKNIYAKIVRTHETTHYK